MTSAPSSHRHAGAAVVLVGHGGVPSDYPRDELRRLKALEGQRSAQRLPPGDEELALDHRLRHWPRSAETDPYRTGIEALAAALREQLGNARLVVAYNEFCAPSLAAAVEELIADGVRDITIVPTMLTPGGSHSEVEIPQTLDALRARHADIALRYAWPVDVQLLASMFAQHLGASKE